jgi:hypothetical protein
MSDHAYSFYCRSEDGRRCANEDLDVVQVFHEKYDEDGILTHQEVLYRCRVCGGFYKRLYRAVYYPHGLFDTEEGWSVEDKHYRIEEPIWRTVNSVLKVPLTFRQVRKYGYTGENRSWKDGRCNFPVEDVELTCRGAELQFVAYHTFEEPDHLRDRFYKCRRCGQWYFFKILPPYVRAFLKPSNELFPLEAARFQGYDENSGSEYVQEIDSEGGEN